MARPLQQSEMIAAGVRVSFVELGAEAGKAPLVLLHGLVASAACLAELMAKLPVDRRVVALNLLSAERVDGGELDVSFAGLAALVVGFLEAAGLGRVVLVGHSHGGALALQVAVSRPEALRGMVLLCPAHPFGGYDARMIRFYLTGLGGLFARMLRFLPRGLHRWGQSRVMGPGKRLTLEQLEPYRETFRSKHAIPRVLRLLRSWEADMQGLKEALERKAIETPTLLLWGDHDAVVPIATAPELERHLVQWEQVTLRGVGHLPPEEAPLECAALIKTWLIWRDTQLEVQRHSVDRDDFAKL
jgi:pimeloyl-ACP methyl ester carboxylesterase